MNNAATTQIEKSATKFLAAMGLNAEITRATSHAVFATAHNGKSQILRVLKRGMKARTQRNKNTIKAYLPFGGIVNIGFDLSQPRNERTVELVIENDEPSRYCGEIAAKMNDLGYSRLKTTDVMVWMYGECKYAIGNGKRATRCFRNLLGLQVYRDGEENSNLPELIDTALKIKSTSTPRKNSKKPAVKAAPKTVKAKTVKKVATKPAVKKAVKKVPRVDALFH